MASFEDSGYNARVTAMGGAATALLDDPVSAFINPAGLGGLRHDQFQLNYLRQFDLPGGKTDQSQFNGVAALPVDQQLLRGTFGITSLYNDQLGYAKERELGLSYATRGLIETDTGGLDFGGTIKNLSKSFDAGGGADHPALDFGAIYRINDRYNLGASLMNFFQPGFSGPDGRDRAPLTLRAGFSEAVRDFTMDADVVERGASDGHPGGADLAAGFERWWPLERFGSAAARSGLTLGGRDKVWDWGLGWRIKGAEVDYAMTVPLQGSARFGHALSLVFHFGASDPEAEYEKVLSDEMQYRRQLTSALEAGQVKQWQLGDEIANMRREMEALRKQLADRTTSEADARRRLGDLEGRRRAAEERFKRIQQENARLAARTQGELFRDDWAAYQKLKNGGAPDSVLTDEVRRILLQYKDKGVDLSQANQELVRLLRSR